MRILLSLLLAFLSAPLLACSMGFGFHFARGLPAGYALSAGDGEAIAAFLDREHGPGKWAYASVPLRVRTPDVAENSVIVPVTVGADDAGLAGRYRRVRVFAEKQVDVLDSPRFSPEYLPRVYHVDGEGWREKNHPKALRLHEITRRAAVIVPLLDLAIGARVIPEFSLRMNLWGARGGRVFAVFVPTSADEPVQVAMQAGVTRVSGNCYRTIYVDGDWPADLKQDYYYQ